MNERLLLLVDGYSLVHRAFFALPPLQTREGQPTHAVYGFLNMLLKLLEEEKPGYVAVAWDAPGPTFRQRLLASYKAQRPEAPDAFRSQIPLVREALEALRIPVVEVPGYEADDVIGTLVRRARRDGLQVLVVTGDRDLLQALEPGVRIRLTRKGITEWMEYDREEFRRQMGIEPEQLADAKALMGDPSDNIPGVPGIGEKTALSLIQRYGGVEELLSRLEEVTPPRVREALQAHAPQIRLGRQVASLARDVPVECSWEALRRQEPDAERVRQLFTRLELRSLLRRLGLAAAPAASEAEPASQGISVQVLEGGSVLEELGRALASARGPVGIAHRAPEGWAAVAAGNQAWFLPSPPAQLLGAVMERATSLAVHDAKPLVRAWLAAGGDPGPWLEGKPPLDTAVAAYLIDSSRSHPRVADLARAYGLEEAPEPEDALSAPIWAADRQALSSLAARQAAAVAQLGHLLRAEIEARGLQFLLDEVELPLVAVLASMELVGIRVDPEVLDQLGARFSARLQELAEEIYRVAGVRFNIQSPQQLAEVLFQRLGLPPVKRTKTGYSTDAEVLEELAAHHPLPALVLEYRQLSKLLSTYVEGLKAAIGPDGRVRTTFQQTVAATGRLASTDPNLQNIPIREEPGRQLRRAFVAEPGWLLLSADYSQVELRVLAHVSGDEGMIEAFRRGEDIHRRTAAEVFGVPLEAVTEAQRSAAKAVVFGISYGISDFGLARQLGIPQEQARAIIQRYFERYPGVRRYMEETVAKARETGMVRTLFGRTRTLPDIHHRVPHRRQAAERAAINTPIQGTAADIIKLAMVRLFRRLRREKSSARLLLQVHDELILEVPEGEVAEAARMVVEEMEGAVQLAVPLVVEVKAGPNWHDMEPVEVAPGITGA